MEITRRAMVAGGLVLAVAPARAALPGELAAAEAAFARGVVPVPGPLRIEIPEAVENGAAVPVTLVADSPMTAANHVEAITLLAPDNPLVGVVTCHFTPMSGLARATTRVRLARSQTVVALARLSDGTVWRTERAVTVSIGGCGS